ncbi:MAG: hydantoinase B/oxoprolinase family protein [Acidobacteriota bacterium]
MSDDAIALALFTHRFGHLVDDMGAVLAHTALSTNVRDRLDFSCALLDRDGRLVVNAPHIPVHLGALGPCVRRVAAHLALRPGDVVVTNHPGFGGSHLPDVTVITPVWAASADGDPEDEAGDSAMLLGYVASRAHHAEIGGVRPGSMPPGARVLAEEGVVLPPIFLARGGVARWSAIEQRLREGPWPSRAVADNLADLRAQVAANRRGAVGLRRLAIEHGPVVVADAMASLRAQAAARMMTALGVRAPGTQRATQRLDDGTPLAVAITVAHDAAPGPDGRPRGRATIDLRGSGGVHPGNRNAPFAVVRSAVLYALRLLIDAPLPLNEGLLDPVALIAPEGVLNPPFDGPPAQLPAVVAGNVETSQRVVDLLLRALRLSACSQGTMNSVLFGTDHFGYYETVCGGTGAGPGFRGASGVHSHMTNTRITDPEVLETRYPVRLERFALRRGSGGAGRGRGGDGNERGRQFGAPVAVSLLSEHRVEAPYGVDGGAPGARGRQRLVRADGSVEPLGGDASIEVAAGDRLWLETPGGGGWGAPIADADDGAGSRP